MKHIKRIITLILALGMLPLGAIGAAAQTSEQEMRALFVNTLNNADFPSKPNLSARAMRQEIEEIIAFSKDNRFNTILFEARAKGDALYSSKIFPTADSQVKEQGDFTFFDPLKELVNAAKKENITVYAVVDPYYLGSDLAAISEKSPAKKSPELVLELAGSYYLDPTQDDTIRQNASDISRICQKYDVGGILLKGFDDASLRTQEGYSENFLRLVENLRASIGGKELGVYAPSADIAAAKILSAAFDKVICALPAADAAQYYTLGKNFVPFYDVAAATAVSPTLSSQLIAARQQGISQMAAGSYSALTSNRFSQGSLLLTLGEWTVNLPKYSPSSSLTITKPTNTAYVNTATYFICGTSDASLPLSMNGSNIPPQNPDGHFGILVNLVVGKNTFTFRQGNKTETAVIYRTSTTTPAKTDKVTFAYPVSSAIVKSGEMLTISCVAPSGSSVSANIAGIPVTLKQKAAASDAIPATFSGEVTLTGAQDEEVKSIGKITYTLTHNGKVSTISSEGEVFVYGENARPRIEVTDKTTTIFADKELKSGYFKSIYKPGTREEIVGQQGEHYELASGGFAPKSYVKVIAQEKNSSLSIGSITANHKDNAEIFVLKNAASIPYTFQFEENGDILLNLHGDFVLPSDINRESQLFSAINWQQNETGISCRLTPADKKKVWGADILYNGSDAYLYFKKAPSLSDDLLSPLSGITVMIDPGHGGNDSGALGTLGLSGPFEKDLNLANSYALKQRLEQLGATVVMTRENTDQNPTLFERVALSQEKLPDLFIAMHHNSISEGSDGYKSDGVEVYFYEQLFSKNISDNVLNSLSIATNRKPRRSQFNYFVVNRMSHTPSILIEIGFISNPDEYRASCDANNIYKTADAIACAVLKTVSDSQ